jgi:competence protein ComEC
VTPLVRFVVAFAAGILVGLRFGGDVPGALAAVGGVTACALALVDRDRRGFVAAVLSAGLLHGSLAAASAAGDCRTRLPDGAVIEATVHFLEPPAPGHTTDSRLEALAVDGHMTRCGGTVRVRVPARTTLDGATHARIAGAWWSDPVAGRWPRPPEWSGLLAGRTVRAIEGPGHRHPLTALRAAAIRTAAVVFRRERPLAESMLLARRDDLDPELRQRFAAAGLAHMLAISGAHVGILAGALLLLVRLAGAGARLAPAVAALGTIAYVVFLGAPAAATRAALQAVLLLASRFLQRPADPLSLMAFAALAILAIRPLSVLQPGFQLSFAGVYGLLAFREPLAVLIPQRLPGWVRQGTAATLAASLATAPIAAWHFGIVSVIGPLSNLVAAPLVALALPAAALALVAGFVVPGAGAFLGDGAGMLLYLLRVVAEVAARPAWGHVWVTSFGVTAAVLGVAVAWRFAPTPPVADGVDARRRLRSLRSRLLIRATTATVAAVLLLAIGPVGRGALEIHAIDVGQGDAIAIRTPRGHWLLIDAGPRTRSWDAGRQRVTPYLLARGARRIDVLLLTHPDADHVGGAQWLWHAFDIGAVLDPAVATGKAIYTDALEEARMHGTRWLAAREGREIRVDDVVFRILAPSDSFLDHPHDSNDLSAVVRLEYGSFGALFLGDAPREVEDGLVERFGSGVRSQVIKVGHHGSRTSTGDSLLNAARPVLALISVGRHNRYGHPAPDVLRRLEDHGVRVLRTDEGGSIEVRVRPGAALEVRRRR